MKQLLLKEILLLSQKEKSALSLKFDSKRTVIVGLNSTGKSCLMKSIYYTFGAQPHQMHSSWVDAQVSSLVRFTIDRLPYAILKQGKFYTLFDLHDEIIAQTTKASEIGVVLAELFDFKIRLMDKKGEVVTPPPAYLFLPFYVDQDQGWSKTWSSFDRLYLPNAKKDIASYHTGLRPNEYYEAKGEIKVYEEQIKGLDNEEKLVRNLLGNLKQKLTENDFNISIEDFQKEITELLVECENLNTVQNRLKHNLSHFYNSKINLEAQQKITKRALEESHSDYVYAADSLGDTVLCPSCGAEYENDFASRFGMAQDEQRCLELLAELKEELVEVDKAIQKVKQEFSGNNSMIVEIEKKLEAKKEEVKLKDLIASEGKREIRTLLEAEVAQYRKQLAAVLLEKHHFEDIMKATEDKTRKGIINGKYLGYMSRFLKNLNVYSLDEKSYKSITSTIKESGSTQPRALMAYYYSTLHLASEYGSSAFCPIVIDAPNQQGQDKENLPLMLKFIIDNQPENSQLILAIEETHNIDFGAKIVNLTRKRKLLDPASFEAVKERMGVFLTRAANYA